MPTVLSRLISATILSWGGENICVVIILHNILAMVALFVNQAKETFYKDGVLFIPKSDSHTDVLESVADSPKPIFVPAVGSAAGVVMGEVFPFAHT